MRQLHAAAQVEGFRAVGRLGLKLVDGGQRGGQIAPAQLGVDEQHVVGAAGVLAFQFAQLGHGRVGLALLEPPSRTKVDSANAACSRGSSGRNLAACAKARVGRSKVALCHLRPAIDQQRVGIDLAGIDHRL